MAVLNALKNNYGRAPRATWDERVKTTIKALPGGLLPFFILGSIYAGVVTPTEAAVLSVFYTVAVSIFIYKELKLSSVRQILRESINISSMIYLIISAAMLFSLFLTAKQVPQAVAAWIADNTLNKYLFFALTNLMFFVMGTFLEAVSITLITLPLLLPIIYALDIDIVQFAVVMTVNMELAMITPPVGLNLFVVSAMAREKLEEVVKGVLPFILVLIFALILFVLWPGISTYIPRELMHR